MWDAEKAVFRGKGLALNEYIRKEEKSKINNVSLRKLRKLVKGEQIKSKESRRK